MSDTLVSPLPVFDRATRLKQYYALTKPRVVQLIVFCAVIGMLLAVPGLPDWKIALTATAGIWLVAGAAAALNCVVEQQIDAKMARTSWRPTAKGQLTNVQTVTFSAVLCAIGSAILYFWVNPLTMWLTFATFVGYAIVYTVLLKPATPQNIVIGGASGAMPPVLGWAAIRGDVGAEALILCLIIFLWTTRTSGPWPCTAPRTTARPACRCCPSPTEQHSLSFKSFCTRWCCSPRPCCLTSLA
jgi:protoheme IX farnesyltransferase